MNADTTPLNIVHRPEIGRFEAHVEGLRCEVDYLLDGRTVRMTHTGVPAALEGRGIAAQLVKAALTWARSEQLKVVPLCSYVQVYLRRHPEWQDLAA
ncbi:GNAT family N-acetyltransferase [Aquabacterium sp.]|jgi:predicted GNAT family acetyltransferase|uniref:GNAT family N-acetyltransferase n=1 Tax=Aquabacterium sp. TaxID=1872578 RepID=UPI0025BF7AB5|nr:GNAT family N-acetyltransferase [Aquabacterium sp.]